MDRMLMQQLETLQQTYETVKEKKKKAEKNLISIMSFYTKIGFPPAHYKMQK